MNRFTEPEIEAVYRAIRERRDMRHFLPDPLPEGMLERLVTAAHLAPSVGFMQPWRFIRITDRKLRRHLHQLVMEEKELTAQALPSRNEEFRKVKIEGMLDCAELLAVVLMPERERHLIGRRLLPEMDVASVGCAIQNMWLAARAEGIGLGWVSFRKRISQMVINHKKNKWPKFVIKNSPIQKKTKKIQKSYNWNKKPN